MEYTTSFKLSKAYFRECFDQSIQYGNNRRRVEHIIGTLALVTGISLFIYTDLAILAPLVFIIIGTYELSNPFMKKIKWINRQMSSEAANIDMEICISDKGITSKSSYKNINMPWTGIKKIVETPKGILFFPRKGMHIYLQKKSLPQGAVEFIFSKTV